MLLLEDYLKQTDASRRMVFYNIAAGKLQATKLNGRTYILNTEHGAKSIGQKAQKSLVKDIRKALDNIILFESDDKAEAVKKIEAVVKHWQAQGIVIKGYNAKSIYRKISRKKIVRKSRGDKGEIRNEQIAKILESHILPLAASIYFKNAKANIKLTVDLMIEYAKSDENFYEIAAMSPHTLWKILKREFWQRGIEDKHAMLNHYNLWYVKNRATCTGAFTDDIGFMDYLLGDDNKRNVASAWTFNPVTRKKELKQINSWSWVEARTGKILSYKNTTGELNTDDVILTLVEALQTGGLPNKGIIIDNGIGSSKAFKDFFNRLNFAVEEIAGPGNKIILKLGKPYHPLDKAPVERSFGWTKDEFDGFRNNFVGDNHKLEGRHKSNCLTPEESDYMFEDYDKAFKLYAHGFYETRLRNRVINGVKKYISIRDYFNNEAEKRAVNPVPEKAIRFALQNEKEFTYKGGPFSLKLKGTSGDYLPVNYLTSMPSGFYNRKYKVLFNPQQLNEVDLYALETFTDKQEGLFIHAGDFICTLRSVRTMNTDKQKLVAIHNKEVQKAARKLSVALTPVDVFASVNENAQFIDAPKILQREIQRIITDEKPLEQIAVEARENVKTKIDSFRRLTMDDLDDILRNEQLTINNVQLKEE